MIERPSSKPGLVNTPETKRLDETTSTATPSVEQRPESAETSSSKPIALPLTSDSFAANPATQGPLVSAVPVERGLEKSEGKPVGPRTHVALEPLLDGSKTVQVERGENWEQTLARHYGKALTPQMVRLVAEANGQMKVDGSPPSIISAPTLEQLYYALHPGEREVGRSIIQDSDFVVVSPGQSIQDVIRQQYGDRDEDVIKVLGEAALYLNDASRYAAPPGVMALPSIDGLNNLITRMKREIKATQARRDAVDEIAILPPLPPTPGRKLRTLLVNDRTALYTIPTEGARYQTEWNDRLADVVLYVYRDQLTEPGLSPEEADERLKELMLAVARINDLTTVDVGAVRELYLPEVHELHRFMGDRHVRQNQQRFKRANNLMWQAIEQTSQGAQNKALALKKVDIRDSAPDGDERMKQIAQTDSVIKDMQVEKAFDNAPLPLIPYVGTMLWVINALKEKSQDVEAGALKFRRADETTVEYAQRLFSNTLSARELQVFEKHPEMLLAVHLNVMSRNGKFEPGQREALKEGLSDLGLMKDGGKINLEGCCSEEAIDAITARTFLDNVDLDLTYEEGESIDSFFSRALRESPVEGDQETIRQLLFFNVMAKRQLQIAEEGDTGVVEPPAVDLDEVEMSMGLRSGPGYENFGSTLSDYEREVLGSILLNEPSPVLDKADETDEAYVSERASRLTMEALAGFERASQASVELSDARKEEIKEAFEQMMRMLAELEDSVDRYELKIQEGMRVVMTKLMDDEPLGAPASWFG